MSLGAMDEQGALFEAPQSRACPTCGAAGYDAGHAGCTGYYTVSVPRPTAPCRLCGRPIVWGEDRDGKRYPLDPRPPAYRITGSKPDGSPRIERDRNAMVLHHATCAGLRKASSPSTAGNREGL